MKAPLSSRQRHVLERMRNGWELGYSRGCRATGRYWLQHGGLGRGGTSEDVLTGTVDALLRRHLIMSDRTQDMFATPRRFVLTQDGLRIDLS